MGPVWKLSGHFARIVATLRPFGDFYQKTMPQSRTNFEIPIGGIDPYHFRKEVIFSVSRILRPYFEAGYRDIHEHEWHSIFVLIDLQCRFMEWEDQR